MPFAPVYLAGLYCVLVHTLCVWSSFLVSMAVPLVPETSFVLLLQADSEHALPNSDPEVVTALASYGAAFRKTKKEAPARLELLAGLMWVHVHQHDLMLSGLLPRRHNTAPSQRRSTSIMICTCSPAPGTL